MSHSHHHPEPDHRVKIPHLVFGLFFLGLAGIWAVVVTGVITPDRLTVLTPAVLIAAGVIGLAASLAGSRNRNRNRAEQPLHHTTNETETETEYHPVATGDEPTEEIR